MKHAVYEAPHRARGRKILLFAVLSATALSPALPARATPAWPVNGALAFVRSEGCKLESIKPKVMAAGEALAKDKTTSFVAVDLPAYPDNNADRFGNPSPYVAAVEVNAPRADVPRIIRQVQSILGIQCKVDVFSVHERRLASPPRTRPLAMPAPKGFTFLIRKAGTTHDFFVNEWSGKHVELVLGRNAGQTVQATAGPASQSRRYIHHYVIARSKGSLPLDGIAEGGGQPAPTPESIQQMKAMAAAPVTSDAQKHAPVFLDMDKTQMFSAQEFVLKD